jgi:predicted Fe-Mo cluster-binding NifX family protein
MKIAITSKGEELNSIIDPRFGRAAFILIIDTENDSLEAINNETNVNAFKGAGIQAATMVHDKGAKVLLTGFCGPKAFTTLEAAQIKVVNDITGTVAEVLENFKQDKYTFAENANTEGHW